MAHIRNGARGPGPNLFPREVHIRRLHLKVTHNAWKRAEILVCLPPGIESPLKGLRLKGQIRNSLVTLPLLTCLKETTQIQNILDPQAELLSTGPETCLSILFQRASLEGNPAQIWMDPLTSDLHDQLKGQHLAVLNQTLPKTFTQQM